MLKNAIWITGANGRIGSALVKKLKKNVSVSVIGTDMDVDVTDLEAVRNAANIYKPSVIINCASISDAAYCEEHRVEAFRVNTLGARNLAIASSQVGARLIHLSSDDVFSGENRRPKNEFDIPTPKMVYGQSKFAGENFVKELNPKHLIIRSSWVYTGKDDFLAYVLDKGAKGEKFEVSMNHVSTPTSVSALVDFIMTMLESKEYGIYHASCTGMCSRQMYAMAILKNAGYDVSLAEGTLEKYRDSQVSTLLENLMMEMTGVYQMPAWETELEAFMKKKGVMK